MISFPPAKNMTFFEYVYSYIKHFQNLFDGFLRYRRTYKNYFHVIKKFRTNDYPIKAVLRNGKNLTLNRFQVLTIARGLENYCNFNNDLLVMKIRNMPEIKMYDWEYNGDFYSTVLFHDEYESLDIKNKEVVDIGANNGDSTIYFALRGARNVIALEPLPKNYESAKKNIELNNLSNKVDLIMAGASNKKGHIHINAEKSGVGYSLENDESNGIEVPILTLEDILQHSKADSRILKLDCEGCEYDTIISSSKETLRKFNHIAIEYHYGYKNLVNKLEKCGFKVSHTKPEYFFNKYTTESNMYLGFIHASRI